MKSVEGGSLMGSINSDWLPHLSPEVVSETEGNYLDAYVVALEGWRRGLTLRWHVKDSEKFKEMKTWYVDQPGQLFSLHSKDKSHYFFRTRGDKVPNEAVEKGMDKDATKQLLAKAGIPVPEGKQFSQEQTVEEMLEYAREIGYPVVIKPTDGSFGRGVLSDIQTEEELRHSIDYLRTELNPKQIIVERYVPGEDYRLYVVGDEVIGAILRVPPNVVGDGINSIESLIEIKNNERNLNPRLVSCPILTDDETVKYLEQYNYTLDTVPEKDQIIYTNNKANISLGGDPIDVLDEISNETRKIAIQALQAIPELGQGAVDLLLERCSTGEERGYVIELNPTAQLGGILFPIKGQPRDIPSAIIDYYFPETKRYDKNLQQHFNFHQVLNPLIKGVAQVTKVSPCIRTNIESKKITLTGKFSEINVFNWLRNIALELSLNGFIQVHAEDKVQIVAMGESINLREFKTILMNNKQPMEVTHLEEIDWKEPVQLGFEIIDGTHDLIQEINTIKKETATTQKQMIKLEKEYQNMLNSNSWKITAPLRKLTGGMKKKM